MAITKCEKSSANVIPAKDIKALGYNILQGKTVTVVDMDTGEAPRLAYGTDYVGREMEICTDEQIEKHVDIYAKRCEIVYDLGEIIPVEVVEISSFFHFRTNYTLGEFELFASDEREKLFDPNNRFAYENNGESAVPGGRNNSDWMYFVEGDLRYFGIRIHNSNITDEIARPRNFGLYSKEYTKQRTFAKENFPKNYLMGLEPKCVTDNILFDDKNCFKVEGNHLFEFNFNEPQFIDNLWVVTKGEAKISFLANEAEISSIENEHYKYEFKLSKPIEAEKLEVSVEGNVNVELIGAFYSKRQANVYFEREINTDFMGTGVNVLPMSLMPEAIEKGYNEVYWELEKRRILLTQPNVVRMWFQPEWAVENFEDYKAGKYDFDTPRMRSVLAYLDAFKEAGTEILLNFGWKISTYAQDWLAFDGLTDVQKRTSAPRDLDLYAKCCAELLHKLIVERGYTNIKYLTFYNEPNYGEHCYDGEFRVLEGNKRDYWIEMLKKCIKTVKEKGLDIKFWGPEVTATEHLILNWIDYFEDKKAPLDCYTMHAYIKDAKINGVEGRSNAPTFFAKMMKACGDKPLILSECCQTTADYDGQYTWDRNNIQYLWEFSRAGASGALYWCINAMFITDPLNFYIGGDTDFWDMPHRPNAINRVNNSFYEWAMLCRYIPNHSISVETSFDLDRDDYRVSAFKTRGGDYTVVLEVRKSKTEREFTINLDKAVGKRFYKHVFKLPCLNNGNAILPPVVGEIDVEDKICDTVSGDYQAIVYTTIAPVPQIVLPLTELFLNKGEKFNLTAETLDFSGDIKWEIINAKDSMDDFILTLDGSEIKASKEAASGNMCALKAYSADDPTVYSVMIVKIR